MNIQTMIDRCEAVVVKWSQRSVTAETVEDFAAALGMRLSWHIEPAPHVNVFEPKTEEPSNEEPVAEDEPQYELFNELSVEDKYAMKSWRKNNGL